jgi:predicted N-formylglutamate amidohydrolase
MSEHRIKLVPDPAPACYHVVSRCVNRAFKPGTENTALIDAEEIVQSDLNTSGSMSRRTEELDESEEFHDTIRRKIARGLAVRTNPSLITHTMKLPFTPVTKSDDSPRKGSLRLMHEWCFLLLERLHLAFKESPDALIGSIHHESLARFKKSS